MKTIAIDFDGVIHKYSKGWQDGVIYDEPIKGAEEFLRNVLIDENFTIFIFSTRNARQIKKWLIAKMPFTFGPMAVDCGMMNCGQVGWDVKIIPFWTKFWNKTDAIGITNRKLPAIVYIDDRAVKFEGGNWDVILNLISNK